MSKTKEQKIIEPAEGVLDKLFLVAKVADDRGVWDAASKLNVALSEVHLALQKVDMSLDEIDLDGDLGISSHWRTTSGENSPWLSVEKKSK